MILWSLTLAALLTPAGPVEPRAAQDKPRFASCGWWQTMNEPDFEYFRIGFTQGMVVGELVELFPETPDQTASAIMDTFKSGKEVYLGRPSMLEEYFAAQCKDPRNASVQLDGLTLLAYLEKGGLKPEQIEAALQLYRNEFAPKRDVVLAALTGR